MNVEKIIGILGRTFIGIIGISGGFFIICTGVFLFPLIPESMPKVLYSLGISGAAVAVVSVIFDIAFYKKEEKEEIKND